MKTNHFIIYLAFSALTFVTPFLEMETKITIIVVGFIIAILLLLATNKPKPEDKDQISINPAKVKVCNVCKTTNNINRVYCRKCNTMIKNIVCPVCNHKNPYDRKYCQSCGSILQNKRR